MSGTTVIILGAAGVIAMQPEWFVGPTGRIPFFGGVTGASLFAIALWLRSRVARAVTALGLLGWLGVTLSRYHDGTIGRPVAHLVLAVLLAVALAMLLGAAFVAGAAEAPTPRYARAVR